MKPRGRQIVVLIHGIGEQMPMQTVRRFIDSVCLRKTDPDSSATEPRLFSKPDRITGNVALPLISMAADRRGVRTDFVELYWADLMTETNFSHVLAWARVLVLRWPWTLPRRLRWIWLLLVLLTIGVSSVVVLFFDVISSEGWQAQVAGLVVSGLADYVFISTLGDAARYLDRAPRNMGRRVEIMTRGVELINAIHDSERYERVIVVGHSLGSVIGYDILTYAWSLYHSGLNDQASLRNQATNEIERLASRDDLDVRDYQHRQRSYQSHLRASGCKWLVTDFITLGSPLAHAAVLLANDPQSLRARQLERELPTCPPALDRRKFTFMIDQADGTKARVPHYAAVFGPTRWTNIYFRDDVVGGPVGPAFGRGIRDIVVRRSGWLPFVSHLRYWLAPESGGSADAVRVLQEALDLVEQDDPAVQVEGV